MCANTSNFSFLLPDTYSQRLLTYKDLLWRLDNHPISPAILLKHAEVQSLGPLHQGAHSPLDSAFLPTSVVPSVPLAVFIPWVPQVSLDAPSQGFRAKPCGSRRVFIFMYVSSHVGHDVLLFLCMCSVPVCVGACMCVVACMCVGRSEVDVENCPQFCFHKIHGVRVS
jgi:hypothetical protein